MPIVSFPYKPEHLAFCDKPVWVSATDGDTPTLQFPIRMLGIDAPELHYEGAIATTPGKYDAPFSAFLTAGGKDLDDGLKQYLAKKLIINACTRHIAAGQASFEHFEALAQKRLARKGKNGKPLTPRHLFVMVAEEVFDRHRRMLAYVNGVYEKNEREAIPESKRPTFNLQMLQAGQAVSLLIYPNIPKPADLELVQTAVYKARTTNKGFWKGPDNLLLPYEFRWIIDTIKGTRTGPDRYCADISTGKLYQPQQYYKVLPESRLFFYATDLVEALKMNFQLVP
ncbi:MAG TPA: thermonuclease family protein [Nitrospiraceae bacterium]|nr:thermonuclease family protein [Nitrospiraceae bacterium]